MLLFLLIFQIQNKYDIIDNKFQIQEKYKTTKEVAHTYIVSAGNMADPIIRLLEMHRTGEMEHKNLSRDEFLTLLGDCNLPFRSSSTQFTVKLPGKPSIKSSL